jgi:ubiquinone/menaquinone biosynthesis C-methylase UbiE
MRFRSNFLGQYVREAPLPLAIERTHECEILSRQEFVPPILDIGCGDGIFAHVLFDEPVDVGIDVNAVELESAKAYGRYRELIHCSGSQIPREAKSFNTIFSNSVLEHIVEIEAVLEEAQRLLSPTGTFYATVPSHLFDHYSIAYELLSLLRLRGLAERYRKFFNRFWRHYHYFDRAGWTALFAKHGFEVVKFQEYCPRATCVLDDLLAPFSLPSLFAKKLFNRWFVVPPIRRLYAPVLRVLASPWVRYRPDLERGGIFFFALKASGSRPGGDRADVEVPRHAE